MTKPALAGGPSSESPRDDAIIPENTPRKSPPPEPQPNIDRLIRLLATGPQVPYDELPYKYARMALSMLTRPDMILSPLERDLHDLAELVRTGRIHFTNDESFLNAADKALAGNGTAFEFLTRWIKGSSNLQNALRHARSTRIAEARRDLQQVLE